MQNFDFWEIKLLRLFQFSRKGSFYIGKLSSILEDEALIYL
jgi:hypothetical protein